MAIKNPLAVPRAAVAPPKIAPGVQMVKEVKKEVTQDLYTHVIICTIGEEDWCIGGSLCQNQEVF